ncbi:MAG TPA: cyanophycin synthetase, partial [bacterium]|nr:cyanophycin synthetase [bacterium]
AGDVLVINDAYNASPASMEAAFEVLAEVASSRRTVAVLGEMKELGSEAVALHRAVGFSLARRRPGVLVAVERLGRAIAEGALAMERIVDAIVEARR